MTDGCRCPKCRDERMSQKLRDAGFGPNAIVCIRPASDGHDYLAPNLATDWLIEHQGWEWTECGRMLWK